MMTSDDIRRAKSKNRFPQNPNSIVGERRRKLLKALYLFLTAVVMLGIASILVAIRG